MPRTNKSHNLKNPPFELVQKLSSVVLCNELLRGLNYLQRIRRCTYDNPLAASLLSCVFVNLHHRGLENF